MSKQVWTVASAAAEGGLVLRLMPTEPAPAPWAEVEARFAAAAAELYGSEPGMILLKQRRLLADAQAALATASAQKTAAEKTVLDLLTNGEDAVAADVEAVAARSAVDLHTRRIAKLREVIAERERQLLDLWIAMARKLSLQFRRDSSASHAAAMTDLTEALKRHADKLTDLWLAAAHTLVPADHPRLMEAPKSLPPLAAT